MYNLLAILVLASGFQIAVETRKGVSEQSFPNTPQGVARFEDYMDLVAMREGKDVKICLVALDVPPGEILNWLTLNERTPEWMFTRDYRAQAEKLGAPANAASTAYKACDAAYPQLRGVEVPA